MLTCKFHLQQISLASQLMPPKFLLCLCLLVSNKLGFVIKLATRTAPLLMTLGLLIQPEFPRSGKARRIRFYWGKQRRKDEIRVGSSHASRAQLSARQAWCLPHGVVSIASLVFRSTRLTHIFPSGFHSNALWAEKRKSFRRLLFTFVAIFGAKLCVWNNCCSSNDCQREWCDCYKYLL